MCQCLLAPHDRKYRDDNYSDTGGGGAGHRDAIDETFAYYAFPEEHWRRLRTNNPLERLMREIRRRTRVVGAFPDGQSCLNLAAAWLRYVAGTNWSAKRYLNMEPLSRLQVQQAMCA